MAATTTLGSWGVDKSSASTALGQGVMWYPNKALHIVERNLAATHQRSSATRALHQAMFIALVAGAALVPLHSARGVAPCRSPLRTAHRAGTACCQAQQPDQQEIQTGQQPPGDEQITSFTDEDGVNRLIGRKIESPGDWIEARSMSQGTPQPLGEPNERGCGRLRARAARPVPFARPPCCAVHTRLARSTPSMSWMGTRQLPRTTTATTFSSSPSW